MVAVKYFNFQKMRSGTLASSRARPPAVLVSRCRASLLVKATRVWGRSLDQTAFFSTARKIHSNRLGERLIETA